ncbi:ComEA family DNA-binding protein [candidate division KSB1 bacterium]|nr:ComEA family DNA-binding protein [candidate division KSB1 bacterium]
MEINLKSQRIDVPGYRSPGKKFGIAFAICVLTAWCAPGLFQQCSASFESPGIGARPLALGGAFVGIADNCDALFMNPAGIAQMGNPELSAFYSRPYGLKELSYSALSFVLPNRHLTTGLGAQTYGYKLYRETTLLIGMGRSFEQKFFYGFSIRYMTLQIENYGSAGCLSLDAGILVKALPYLYLGAFAGNLSRSKIGRENEKLPQILSTGLYFNPLPRVGLSLDVFKDVSFPVEYHCGIEYGISKYLDLRCGVSNNPAKFSGGFGAHLRWVRIDYAVYTHRDLGLSHQVSISISTKPIRNFSRDGISEYKLKSSDKVPKKRKKKLDNLKPDLGMTININTADTATLQRIPGIGEKRARSIIKYREENGPFQALIELERVPGIGIKMYEKIKIYVRLKD